MDEIKQLETALARQALEMGFGTIAIFAKAHDGKVFNIDMQKYHTHKTPKGNTDAMAAVMKMVKALQEANTTGSLSFTIDFNKGQSTKLVVQDAGKHRLL